MSGNYCECNKFLQRLSPRHAKSFSNGREDFYIISFYFRLANELESWEAGNIVSNLLSFQRNISEFADIHPHTKDNNAAIAHIPFYCYRNFYLNFQNRT